MTLLRFTAPTDPAEVDPADVLELLQELVVEVRELRAAVAPDLAQRVAVLAALQAEFGDTAFTATDALEAAAEHPDGELAGARLLGGPVGGLRRLSRRLAKLVNKPANGLALARVGDDRGSSLYAVQNGPMSRLDRHA